MREWALKGSAAALLLIVGGCGPDSSGAGPTSGSSAITTQGTKPTPVPVTPAPSPTPSPGPSPTPSPPNVLLLMMDDLRPELGIYGSKIALTPNMDALGRSGLVFDNAFVSQAVCAPSRIAFLAGLRPDTSGITDLDSKLDTKVPGAHTMPDVFKAAGYQTWSFGKVYHDPYDDQNGWTNLNLPATPGWYKLHPGVIPPITMQWPDPTTMEDYVNANMAKAALAKLGQTHQKFFMAVGIVGTHAPWLIPPAEWAKYTASSVGTPINPEGQKKAPPWAVVTYELYNFPELKPLLPNLPPDIAVQLRWGYMASVSYVDGIVGDIMAQLKASGLADNTIVVLWGDHGYKLGDHGFWGKHSNAEIDIHIPLIVVAPGQTTPGTRTSAIVESTDVFPTLAELAGLPVPAEEEGLSFKPLLSNVNRTWKSAAFAQFQRPATSYGDLMGYTVRTQRYRYTAWVKSDGSVVATELYDLQLDPDETENIAGQGTYKQVVAQLEAMRLYGWKKVRSDVPQ